MSLEALEELAHEVHEAYQAESRLLKRSSTKRRMNRRMSGDSVSVRDIHHMGSDNQDALLASQNAAAAITCRRDMLAAWQDMVHALQQEKVFLQYISELQRVFEQQLTAGYLEDDDVPKVKRLMELLTQTVEHHVEPRTECCFVTLLEVLASYCNNDDNNWKVSAELELMWRGLGQTVDIDVPSHNFRNLAYNMLMSLPWVPNTQDLHWICEIEDDNDANLMDPTPPLPCVQPLLDQIRSSVPLPRRDLCRRIANRLTDEKACSPITIAISSNVEDLDPTGQPHMRRGLGKTTLAAMVACQVQKQFCVLWLSLRDSTWHDSAHNGEFMTFQRYTRYLDELCEQLGLDSRTWSCRSYELEAFSLARKRQEERLLHAKRQMAEILERIDKDVLLVLDQVRDENELQLFRFLDTQSLLVTAESSTLSSVTWTLKLPALADTEAAELFLMECDYPPSHVLNTSLEVKSTVQRCGHHPLTIRTAARWFGLKKVTAGEVRGLEELVQELSTCATKLRHSPTADSDNPSRILSEVMDLMLSPVLAADGQPTKLMKLCLTSMAVVFSSKKVPIQMVHSLWGCLLNTESDALNELGPEPSKADIKRRVRFISEALVSLGLVAATVKNGQSYVAVHHDLQLEYALSLLKTMEVTGESTRNEIVKRWHKVLAETCLSKIATNSDCNDNDDAYRTYVARHLVSHMFQAKMWKETLSLLEQDSFFRVRLNHFGRLEGTQQHLDDCHELRVLMAEDKSATAISSNTFLSLHLRLGLFLGGQEKEAGGKVLETAEALRCIGFRLSQYQHWSDAIDCFKAALRKIDAQCLLKSQVLYSLGTVHLAKNDVAPCLKMMNRSLEVVEGLEKSTNRDAVLGSILLKVGDAKSLRHDSFGALEAYQASLKNFYEEPEDNRVDIGKVLLRKGILHVRVGEFSNAIRVLKKCIKWKSKLGESNGELALAYSHLGDAHLEKREHSEAIRSFKQASRLMTANMNEVEEIDLYVTGGKIRFLNGDTTRCRDLFHSALTCLGEVPLQHIEKRYCYNVCWIARLLVSHEDRQMALDLLDKCLEAFEGNPDCLEMADILFFKGECYIQYQNEEALSYFEQALRIRKEKLDGSDCVIENFKRVGDIYASNGELEKAEKHFEEALQQAEKAYGDANQAVASILYQMGRLKKRMNEKSEALAIFIECLDVQRRSLSDSHPDVANTLHSIGEIYVGQENFGEARKCYSEALEILLQNNQACEALVAETLHVLGFVSRKDGDSERALQLLLDALNLRKESDNTRETCETLAEIGHVHRVLKDPESAIVCYERCLKMMIQEFGEEDAVVGDVCLSLGHSKKRVGQHEEAIKNYERALHVRLAMHDSDHPKVAACRRSLGILHFQLQNLEEATVHLDDYLRIAEATEQTQSMDYVLVLQVMGDIHESNKNYEEADSAWSSAQQIFVNSEDLVRLYPELGQSLERRLEASVSPASPSLFQKLSDGFNRLNEETGAPPEQEPTQNSVGLVQNATFMDD